MPKNAQTTNYCTIALISHASKVMLKILQARLQQYTNHELPDVQAGFRKARGTRDQIANIRWIIKKAREFQKNIYLCFLEYAKAFDCVEHNQLCKILRDENTRPPYLPLEISVGRSKSKRVFSTKSVLHIRWPKYWSFGFSISPSNECSGRISFRMDWLDLLSVQGTLKRLLQHYSSKASLVWCSTLFTVQLSHPYMTTGKTIALSRWTFVDKVMSLLSNMLSRLIIAFLPKSKHLLISWLQPPSALILRPRK